MKKYLFPICLVGFLIASSMTNYNKLDKILDNAAWKNRILVISASEDKHSLIREQYTILKKDLSGLIDRDMILIFPEEAKWMVTTNQADIETHFVPNKKIIHRFELDSSKLNIILIGKDSGVKDITDHISIGDYWFNIIDQMPMRKSEINKN